MAKCSFGICRSPVRYSIIWPPEWQSGRDEADYYCAYCAPKGARDLFYSVMEEAVDALSAFKDLKKVT